MCRQANRYLILFLSLIFLSCAEKIKTEVVNQELKQDTLVKTKIVAFGDSHTYGIKIQQLSYVDDLVKSLGFFKTDSNYKSIFNDWYEIDNQAMGGSKFESKYQYNRIMSYQFKSSDIIVMMLGFNDVVYNGIDIEKLNSFKNLLNSALLHISSSGAKIYIATCVVAPESTYKYMAENGLSVGVDISHGSKEACDLYAQVTREVVAKHLSAYIIDTNKDLNLTETNFIDKVHFNWDIHRMISKMFYDKIAATHPNFYKINLEISNSKIF